MTTTPTAPDDLITTISPHETMWVGSEAQYFAVGRSALTCIDAALRAADKPTEEVRTVLDFPSGYGRVLRYLKQRFPDARFTASDLDQGGVDFCAATFGATPVYSHDEPEKIPLPANEFDLIWVGSLLTHFDAGKWVPFLRFFLSRLRPNGMLVFSAHGRTTHAWMQNKVYDYALPPALMENCIAQYKKSGFGYVRYENSPLDYGVSLSSPSWVATQLARVPELRLVMYSEGAWDRHHDVIACVRGPVFTPNG